MGYENLPLGKQGISDIDGDNLVIDNTGAMVGIDLVHHTIHEGILFSSTHIFRDVISGASVEMAGITGDKNAHLIVVVKAGGKALIEFENGTTFTSNGEAVTAVNRNATSTNTATASIYHSPDVDEDGTVFATQFIPGGGRQNATIGGEAGTRQEYILEPNTNNLIEVTNESPDTEDIFIEFLWYEV